MPDESTNRDRDTEREPIPRFRTADNRATLILSVGVPLLAIIAALFVALNVSTRDNFHAHIEEANHHFKSLAQDIRDIERCYLRRRNCP